MNEFFYREWQGNTIADWIISACISIAAILFSKVLYRLFCFLIQKATARTKTYLDDIVIGKIKVPVIVLIIAFGIGFALKRLEFSPGISAAIHKSLIVAGTLLTTWLFIEFFRGILEFYLTKKEKNQQVLSFLARISTVLFGAFGVVLALNNAGYDVAALIAGLGIGGIALALAAQDTVKNIFGGIIVFVERPFRVGHHIKVRDIEGFVEEIRMRSTRLKGMSGQQILVPNAIFSDSAITNIVTVPPIKLSIPVSISLNNSAENVHRAFKLLREIADDNQASVTETAVYLEKINASSFDIRLDVTLKEGNNSLSVQTDLLKKVIQEFERQNIVITGSNPVFQNGSGNSGVTKV